MRFESFKKICLLEILNKTPYSAFNVIDSCLQMLIFSEFIIAKFVIDSYDYLYNRLTFNWIKCYIYFSFTSSWFRTLPIGHYIVTDYYFNTAGSTEMCWHDYRSSRQNQRNFWWRDEKAVLCFRGVVLCYTKLNRNDNYRSWGVQQLAQGARPF